ncbi:MAG: endonuclease/exonuclease/phosphatase family protein [Flavobacteriales bacterium]|jgi:endonuclease/exonuclease/phosphatase (EEP) superfamily protein YafD|uniref:endonuclease/exonuclease/phosphatase family protein n=1 Tax=Candidatus Ulvibacter alkanivorans TaxID=2267620 RepID=UPI000DF2BF1F|nr:endonuclease/exonuclease/phosphatase family protein [Candidatus Ulvibacter alkanivorans]MCH2489012.1 endonuclease/exonuclease/phosphatase family protein [Flavobacteriales bacterium]
MTFKNLLQLFGALAIILSLLPIIAIDYWWVRMFDFPHIQLTILTFVAIVVFFMRFDIKQPKDYFFVVIMIGCFLFQFTKIYPYMPFAPHKVLPSSINASEKSIKLYTANVYQKNKDTQKLIDDLRAKDADILLFVETNTRWQQAIREGLPEAYKYNVEVPLDNTYGMLLYSKFELIDPVVKYLVDDSIPSIHTKFVIAAGDTIQLYNIHPTPPMPQHNPTSSDRDAEMMKIANLSRESKYPVIVLGDFNDVAWSATTSLFENVGELLDVRKGRGFYNTFNANSFLLRWPLDHIFISSEFRLTDISLGAEINSDHFPTYTHLSFEPEKKEEQRPPTPSEEQLKRAKEQAEGIQRVELDM